ncbi:MULTISPECIES: hypothetical protein [Burkholderia]|uniref:hypothetical protein n=1 Tax=Burkholderia TaxID=32008 RepID=UPI0011B28A2D|nr:hypothetical protein [Burkholderia multivorans]MBU9541376.1 hypothetical protein [Burkholderia multivorans]MCA8173554.1 hypothetical protein [Burkholderia multivorans]MCA8220555.1 hypothetical protein [Burkholderia multivorans]
MRAVVLGGPVRAARDRSNRRTGLHRTDARTFKRGRKERSGRASCVSGAAGALTRRCAPVDDNDETILQRASMRGTRLQFHYWKAEARLQKARIYHAIVSRDLELFTYCKSATGIWHAIGCWYAQRRA